MPYRDDNEALRRRVRALEADVDRLRAERPEVLIERVHDLEKSLAEARSKDADDVQDQRFRWVTEAFRRSQRRVLIGFNAGTLVATGILIGAVEMSSTTLSVAGLTVLFGVWVMAYVLQRCPRCGAHVPRSVRAHLDRHCVACRAPLWPKRK